MSSPKVLEKINAGKLKKISNRKTAKVKKFRKTKITWKTRRTKKLEELEELETALEELKKIEGRTEIEIKEQERINEIKIGKNKLAINSNIKLRIEP